MGSLGKILGIDDEGILNKTGFTPHSAINGTSKPAQRRQAQEYRKISCQSQSRSEQ
jgi:hypothetical protein